MRPIQGRSAPRQHRCHVVLAFLVAVLSLTSQATAEEMTRLYQYDAAGNIVAIEANDQKNGPTIYAMDPAFGRVGDEVVIYGEQLLGNSGASSVYFGGVLAQVQEAQENRLTVLLPAGAQTAPVRVMADGVEGISDQSFVVLSSGIAGEPPISITLVGIGNAPVLLGFPKDSVQAVAFEGNAGDLFTGYVSGWTGIESPFVTVSLLAPDGSQTEIGRMTRLPDGLHLPALGQDGTYLLLFASTRRGGIAFELSRDQEIVADTDPLRVESDGPGRKTRAWFYADVGDSLGLGVDGLSMNHANSTLYGRIYSPSGAIGLNFRCGRSASNHCQGDLWSLPESGVYEVHLWSFGQDLLSYELDLWLSDSVEQDVVTNQDMNVVLERPGQNALLHLSAAAGDGLRMALHGGAVHPASQRWRYGLVAPNGTCLPAANCNTPNLNFDQFVDLPTLVESGDYVLRLRFSNDGYQSSTGAAVLTISEDHHYPIQPDGDPADIHSLVTGQRTALSFSAQAGESFGLGVSEIALHPSDRTLFGRVYSPSGSLLHSFRCGRAASTHCQADLWSVPEDGVYEVHIWPFNGDITEYQAKVWLSRSVEAELAAGVPLDLNLGRPGQNALLGFSGTTGEQWRLEISDEIVVPTGQRWRYGLVTPSGTCLPVTNCNTPSITSSRAIDLPTLPESGAQKVRLRFSNQGWQSSTGEAVFLLTLVD